MTIAETDISVEVVEIYPNLELRLPSKLKEARDVPCDPQNWRTGYGNQNTRYQVRRSGGVWVENRFDSYSKDVHDFSEAFYDWGVAVIDLEKLIKRSQECSRK